MTKKKLSLSDVGEFRKPERVEPAPIAAKPASLPKRGRGRPAERTPYVQLNSRISLETSQQIDEIMDREGCTIREVIEQAIYHFHKK